MATDPIRPDGEPDVAAAELALGLLEGEERAAALRRMLAEPGFAREVERWRDHFATLFAAIPEVAPSAGLGERIIERLDGPPRPRAGLWRPLALASSLAAASLLGVVLVRPDPPMPPPVTIERPAPLIAAFTIEGRDAPTVAVYDAAAGEVRMPGAMEVPSGRSAQLWAIVGDAPPAPLGLFRQAGADGVVAEARMAAPLAAGTTLAISIEPLGGSPTGLPTGPVIGSGTLSQI